MATATAATTSCNLKFTTRTFYQTIDNLSPQALSVVDVNNDKKPDIIVANNVGGSFTVRLNSGDGTFFTENTYLTERNAYPQTLSVVDVNDDHKPDIIVANNGVNHINVAFNFGNGTFHSPKSYPTGDTATRSALTVIDVNNDNKPDIIVVNQDVNNVAVLLNSGNGRFLFQTIYPTGSASHPKSVSVVDVNNDDKLDIIVANSNTNNIAVLLNSGKGTFHNQTAYPTGSASYPKSVSAADVNCDDKPDIIVANSNANNVGIFLNAGNGTFLNQTTYSTGSNSNPVYVSIADVNCDEKPDIIVANYNANNIGIFLNSGNGIFLSQIIYRTSSYSNPNFVSVVDVNNDNKPDIIVINSGMHDIGVWLAS